MSHFEITKYQQILDSISEHTQLSQRETDLISSHLIFRKIKKNQFLLQRDEVARFDSYVNKGCLKASFIDKRGQEHIVRLAIEDEWITDHDSFLNATPSRLEILALEDSELWQIDLDSLEKLFGICPSFERAYRIMTQHLFIRLNRCLISFLSSSAEERYRDFTREHPGYVNRIPQYLIASYLGMSPEYLSRIRSRHTLNGV